MNVWQENIKDFHAHVHSIINTTPTQLDEDTIAFRMRFLQEEVDELKEACLSNDLAQISKEMADVLYVVLGTAVSMGIDMDEVFNAVHASNMSKDIVDDTSKAVKGDRYIEPDIESIIEKQKNASI